MRKRVNAGVGDSGVWRFLHLLHPVHSCLPHQSVDIEIDIWVWYSCSCGETVCFALDYRPVAETIAKRVCALAATQGLHVRASVRAGVCVRLSVVAVSQRAVRPAEEGCRLIAHLQSWRGAGAVLTWLAGNRDSFRRFVSSSSFAAPPSLVFLDAAV